MTQHELWINAGPVGYGVLIAGASGPVAVAYGPSTNSMSEDHVKLIVASPMLANALQGLLGEILQDTRAGAKFSASLRAQVRMAQIALEEAGLAVPL
jgi:hypothetical protein